MQEWSFLSEHRDQPAELVELPGLDSITNGCPFVKHNGCLKRETTKTIAFILILPPSPSHWRKNPRVLTGNRQTMALHQQRTRIMLTAHSPYTRGAATARPAVGLSCQLQLPSIARAKIADPHSSQHALQAALDGS